MPNGLSGRGCDQLDDEFLYLETIGNRSGLPRVIETWFVERDGRYYLVSGGREHAAWVRNIRANPAVFLSIGTADAKESRVARRPATARVLDGEGDDDRDVLLAVAALMQEKYRWSDGLVVELTPDIG